VAGAGDADVTAQKRGAARRPGHAPSGDPDAELLAQIVASRRTTARAMGSLVFVLAVLGWAFEARGEMLGALLRHEIDLSGHPLYVPAHPVDHRAIERIDFEHLHAHLIPDWLVAQTYAETPAGRRRAEYAYRALLESVAPDANLEGLWRELHDRVAADPIASAHRIDYLLWAHDAYMDRLGLPYRLEASMFLRGGRGALLARSYRALVDARAPEGERVRVLQRLDRAPLVESWLGHTEREQEGAFVVADRVLHFAVRHVWPALNPALDERLPPRERGLARHVRREVERAIDPRYWAILAETAEDQQALMEAAASIEARRGCGSHFRVFGLPYRGLNAHSRAMLRLALDASEGSECPDVTLDEATQLVSASERLRATDDLDPALEALIAIVARAVAAHELRHVADGPSVSLACPGCGEAPPLVRAELSGYLAAFGTEGLGYLAALGACSAPVPRDPERAGPDALAIAVATRMAMPQGCTERAPDDLYVRARAAEQRLFGARRPIEVPAFASSLPILARSPVRSR
jgi:hypothetical protein